MCVCVVGLPAAALTTNQKNTFHHPTGIAEQVERILKRNPKFSLTRAPSLQPITRVAMLDRGALGVCCVSSVASVGVSAL